MGLILPNPGSPANGQPLDATPLLANQTAIVQSIQSFDGTQIQAGTLSNAAAFVAALNPVTRTNESTSPFVASGCTWSIVSGLQGTMAGGVVYINGIRVISTGVGSNVFTASQDTYVAIDVNANVTYSAVANGATSPALPANSIWLAKIVTGASAITSIVQSGVTTTAKAIYNLSPLNLISSIFSNQVQSYTNTGNNGGTGYYINLGGIKICWGAMGSPLLTGIGANSTTSALSVSLPVGFFSTIQYGSATLTNVGISAQQYITGNGFTISSIGYYITNNSASTVTAGISWLAIGT